jgi:ABC-2 type transport system permease protein
MSRQETTTATPERGKNTGAPSANTVPDSITQVGVVMRYTFLDYFRSRRFYILLIVGLVISGALTAVVAHYRPAAFLTTALGFYGQWWGASINFVLVLSAIFFGGDAISGEFQNKTGYFTIPNPIRRSSVYVGKFLSAFLAASVILLIFTAITVGNQLYYFPAGVPYRFLESLLFSWFYLAAALGFAFFFSALFKSSSISILVSVILLLFGFNIIQTLVYDIAQMEPWFVLTYGQGIISNVLSDPYPAHVATATFGRFSFTSYNATIPEGLAIIGAYFVVTSAAGLLLFERKEFN